MKAKLGLVHIYTGEGKGKTSASLGLALRAVGHNLRVYIIQFLKSGDTGELFAIERYLPNITIAQYGKEAVTDTQTNIHQFGNITKKKGNNGFYKFLPDYEEKEPARRALEQAFNIATGKEYDVIILDEINYALDKGLVPINDLIKLIKTKKKNIELILTGRNAPKEIIQEADYVTYMKEIKHPYQKGIMARAGIDY